MHMHNSEKVHLDPKLNQTTSTFHVERPFQRYLLQTLYIEEEFNFGWTPKQSFKNGPFENHHPLEQKLQCND